MIRKLTLTRGHFTLSIFFARMTLKRGKKSQIGKQTLFLTFIFSSELMPKVLIKMENKNEHSSC